MAEADNIIRKSGRVNAALAGLRLDQAAASLFPDFSRSRLKTWIEQGDLTLDGEPQKPRTAVEEGQEVRLVTRLHADPSHQPEDIPLNVVFEDRQILVIDKPPGLVVHPAAGNRSGTLQNALLHRHPALTAVPRAGIVHRLDKDTSGLMVVARTLTAHSALVAQLQARSVHREYAGIVWGEVVSGGAVDQPIGRHPVERKKMAVTDGGKPAVTHYRLDERFRGFTALRLRLETGRTHQIRVHMAWLHHPLVGDPVYGGRKRLPAGGNTALMDGLAGFGRQALHARRLAFNHPLSRQPVEFEAPLPGDMRSLLDLLRWEAAA